MALTVLGIGKMGVGMHGDGDGLWLQVTRKADGGLARSWIFRFTLLGRSRYMGLGAYPTRTLAEARDKALEARKLLQDDIDPIDAREAQRATQRVAAVKAMTFRQAAERYIDAHSPAWRSPKVLVQWQGSLRDYAFPVLGGLPVAAIDVGLVMRVIEPLWTTKTTTASRVRQRIEAVLGWATVHGYRSGDNPARWSNHLDKLLPAKGKVAKVEHFTALPFGEIAGFMVALRAQEGVAARALEFAILTAARSGEVLGARWSEIDMAERLWTIPASRMKNGKEHRVPLSDAAIAVVDQMAAVRLNDYVFPGLKKGQPASANTMFYALRHMNRGDLTAHGFRSTFRDWAAERTNFPREVAELALAHTVGDATERAYQRGDLFAKRAQLMEAWAGFCTGEASGNVVRLAR